MAAGQRRVLVTAGASGIGHAMASAFAANGDHVWVTDVDGAALDACPKDWKRDRIDASDPKGMAGLFTWIESEWGGIDVTCANAGVSGPTAYIEDVDPEDFRRCVSVNLEGAFLDFRHFRQPGPRALCLGEMGHHWFDENRCDGTGAARHQGKRDLPGLR
jgi:NAD(P)-dependent dehydrogenase (short-subunit alcohol dehydrogenase family)